MSYLGAMVAAAQERAARGSIPMIARRPIKRYTKNTKMWPESDSIVETVQPGERCDWAKGSVYEQLGWVVPVEDPE